ncbi:MAG TPA: zf-HC2 domain-containing protein [Acidimicrobiales bacterium]|nr:zf-HC2 domain-containing protein [Acidimicrobiales bacterium]
MSGPVRCEEREDALCALALGELHGEERAGLLAHVESCSRCAGLLEHLSFVADSLLELAPAAEPPLGFEVRVLEEMRRLRPPRRHPRRTLVAAAALVVALAGFGLGRLGAGHPAPTRAAPVALATFRSGAMSEGEALAYPGTPGRLLVTVDGLGYSGEVRCVVVTTGGKVLKVGDFWLSNGYGWWGVNLPFDADELHATRLLSIGSHPQVVAQANFVAAS